MSNADVKLMAAAATSLRTESQSPEETQAETLRIDDLLNRAETAVKNAMSGQSTVGAAPSETNVITAPDGQQVIITD